MPHTKPDLPILVTCPKGLAPFLKGEVEGLGLPAQELHAGVLTRGGMALCMRLNLCLRTGHRVLLEIARLRCADPTAMARELSRLPWEDMIPVDGHLTVDSSVHNDHIRDERFANQKAKDAIVDRIAEQEGRRPNSGPDPIGACVFLHWRGDELTVYLDTTGAPLTRRGYRKMPHKAPLQETLAAGVMLATGWDGSGHLLCPMCGSGSLAIEGALIALNRAPGLLRSDFSFRHLIGFDEGAYEELRRELRLAARKGLAGRILCSDHDATAIEAARQNARTAGVEGHMEFVVCDFRQGEIPQAIEGGGNICVLNPEYGARLGDVERLGETYAALGDYFKRSLSGWRGFVITGNPDLAKHIGLKPRRKTPFYNAKIECRLLEYELYQGSRKASKQAEQPVSGPLVDTPKGSL